MLKQYGAVFIGMNVPYSIPVSAPVKSRLAAMQAFFVFTAG